MISRNVGGFRFELPDQFEVFSFDELSYYQRHFQSFAGKCRGVDLVAINPSQREVWLIEVKDYRHRKRTEKKSPFLVMAEKVRDTLAGLFALAFNANSPEQAQARGTFAQERLRVVFLLEQAPQPSKLSPWVIDPRTASDMMKRYFHMIDPHPLVGGCEKLNRFTPWKSQ